MGVDEWKDIPGYSRYQINQHGVVRNKTTNLIHAQVQGNNGYISVYLTSDSGQYKHCLVHRLVGLAWLSSNDKDTSLLDINHKNHIRNDNRHENLEWCTRAENIQYAHLHDRITRTDNFKPYPIVLTNIETGDTMEFKSQSAVARFLNVSHDCIHVRLKRRSSSLLKGFKIETL